MTLSDAMRKGIEQTEPLRFTLMACDVNGEVTQACALGGAYIGVWGIGTFSQGPVGSLGMPGPDELAQDLPCLRDVAPACPGENCNVLVPRVDTLSTRIAHMNDYHEWARERIADWLEHELGL